MSTETKSLVNAGRGRLTAIAEELNDITTNGFKSEDGGLVVSADAEKKFRELITEQKGLRGLLSGFGEYDELKAYLDAPATSSLVGGQNPAVAAQMLAGQQEWKSIGERFVESDAFKARSIGGNMADAFELSGDLVGGNERKDLYTAAGGTLTRFSFGNVQREPLVPRPYRASRVRDLFPVARTTANLIEYLRVLGYLDGNNAGMIPERDGPGPDANFGLKPHTKLQLQPAQAPIRTIAHYEVAHRNTLADEPQLQSIIDTELLYGLRLMEDAQLLNGDGTGENILGILRTPGVQNYPGSPLPSPSPVLAQDTFVDAVRRAATRVMLAYYEPTGVVVHPFDWERMETIKDANGNYIVAVNVSIGAEKRIWQMPVIATPAMQQGTALVGAFGLGAKVYDREQSNIRIAEQHADLFLRNAVAVLAEERIGMTVSRPEAFVKIDLVAGSA